MDYAEINSVNVAGKYEVYIRCVCWHCIGGANMELSLVPFVFFSILCTCSSNSVGGSSSFLFDYFLNFGHKR